MEVGLVDMVDMEVGMVDMVDMEVGMEEEMDMVEYTAEGSLHLVSQHVEDGHIPLAHPKRVL